MRWHIEIALAADELHEQSQRVFEALLMRRLQLGRLPCDLAPDDRREPRPVDVAVHDGLRVCDSAHPDGQPPAVKVVEVPVDVALAHDDSVGLAAREGRHRRRRSQRGFHPQQEVAPASRQPIRRGPLGAAEHVTCSQASVEVVDDVLPALTQPVVGAFP